jgi:hypothetical protein
MWFPPYDLTFSEQISARWNSTDFIGRPEPIYTYGNSTRSGSLSFKIVVDHPSILNLITDRVLKGKTAEEANSILESFFAGCKEYDLYQLAEIYNTIPLTELQQIQTILNETTDPTTIKQVTEQLTPEPAIVPPSPPETGAPTTTDQVCEDVVQIDTTISPNNFEVYFRNEWPKPGNTDDFKILWINYTSPSVKNLYINPSPNPEGKLNFFNDPIGKNIEKLDQLCIRIIELCQQNAKVTVSIDGNTSSVGNEEYNLALSQRRIASVRKYISQFSTSGVTLSSFENGKLFFKENPRGETGSNQTVSAGTQSQTVTSLEAIQDRNVQVKVTAEAPPMSQTIPEGEPEVQPDTDVATHPGDIANGTVPLVSIPRTIPTTTVTETREVKALPGLAKKVLRNLLSECSYFEMMKEDSPVVYDSLQEKLKYFHPAFHSITPEGLNSRLTFLNQCAKPGSTIPVINDKGQEVINDAENTAFGAPPICILRVGDFYNTKIIINSIQIQYENLDINPEGIGIQPMIATVSLSFDFIGGSGLKEPINRLQNALSFNYYANTEMYDERADATEDTSEIDNNLYKQIQENQIVKTQGVVSQNNPGGTYIGAVVGTEINSTGFTGTINYEPIITDTKENVRSYVYALTNNLQAIATERGWGFMTEMNRLSRFYENGTFDVNNVQIYGSPQNIQGRVDSIFATAIEYFNNDQGYILEYLSERPITNKNKRAVKKNLTDFVTNKKTFISGNMVLKFNEVNNEQVALVKNINKLNYVTTQLSDGFINQKGETTITTITLPTLPTDSPFKEITTLSENLNDFLLSNLTNAEIFEASPNIEESPGQYYYEYLTLYEDIIEKDFRIKFIEYLLTNVSEDEKSAIQAYLNAVIGKMISFDGYQKEKDRTEKQFGEAFVTINQIYEVYNPFQESTGFVFNLTQNTSPNSTQIDELKNLYDGINTGPNTTFNGKEKFI